MDPLAQLKDIHLPDQIHHYPIAIGWWILAVLVIAVIFISVIKIKQYRKVRQAKNKAIKHIKQATNNNDIVSLLKWACLQYFPREAVAPLYGENFYLFLHEYIPSKQQENFSKTIEPRLNEAYQNNSSELDVEFKNAVLLFLSQALPPKAPKDKKNDKTSLPKTPSLKTEESH